MQLQRLWLCQQWQWQNRMLGGSSAEVVAAVVKFWQDCGGSRASREGGGGRGGFHFLFAVPPADRN